MQTGPLRIVLGVVLLLGAGVVILGMILQNFSTGTAGASSGTLPGAPALPGASAPVAPLPAPVSAAASKLAIKQAERDGLVLRLQNAEFAAQSARTRVEQCQLQISQVDQEMQHARQTYSDAKRMLAVEEDVFDRVRDYQSQVGPDLAAQGVTLPDGITPQSNRVIDAQRNVAMTGRQVQRQLESLELNRRSAVQTLAMSQQQFKQAVNDVENCKVQIGKCDEEIRLLSASLRTP